MRSVLSKALLSYQREKKYLKLLEDGINASLHFEISLKAVILKTAFTSVLHRGD